MYNVVDGKKSQEKSHGKKSRKKVTGNKVTGKKVTIIKDQEKYIYQYINVVRHDFHVKIKQ